MKLLKQGLGLVLLGASLSAVPTLQTAAVGAPAAADTTIVQQMRSAASDDVEVSKERATGKVTFVRVTGDGDLMPSVGANASRADAVDKARAYVDEYAAAFGARAGDLVRTGVQSNALGRTVTYEQEHDGIRVFGSALRAHLDPDGRLTAVNGELVPVGDVDTEAALSETEAGERAVRMVEADPPTNEAGQSDTEGIRATSAELVVYRHGLLQGLEDGETSLVYQVEVSNDANVRDMVFLDADSGKAVNRYSMVHDALSRELYEESPAPEDRIWKEGDPFPGSLNEEQQRLVEVTGQSYWFFMNSFGRDSYDNNGATMKTVNNDPTIACPNANWNGATTNYCSGVTGDDTVAHEWGHAYTEYTHGLIYQWQSGALNESYSDIWGETVDMINGQEPEDATQDVTRTVGVCSSSTRGPIAATINSPASIEGPCEGAAPAAFGPVIGDDGVTSDVVVAVDPDEDGAGDTSTDTDGCSPYTNAGDVSGKFAYVDRGVCTFAAKAANAEAAGATGIIVGDNVADRAPISMTGVADIYGAMVTKADGDKIKSVRPTPVNITLVDDSEAPVEDSTRWLSGEGDPAFGGAIRDMWQPNCYGDPGKVSDAQYFCDTDDGGGVHSNSGVPNHGYALLVDGGEFNGQTVQGIGLDRAAHIYYRAMMEYQTPASDFADHADALESSCTDLIGEELTELSVEANDAEPLGGTITQDDCNQVEAMTAAVELRRDPTAQCEFEPMFKSGVQAGCGPGFTEKAFFTEDFADGLDGWEQTSENPFGGPTLDWEATSEYPIEEPEGDGHTGQVAFGGAPDQGQCDGSTEDFSSVNYLTSSDITVPADAQAPRMSFAHYVATEFDYDGGNVQVSVGGEEFAPIPAAAFVANEPDSLASEADGSTNPLAGQPGFTGTNPGHAFGSWGTSVVDLTKAGVTPGDTIQLRFAIGRDGCGGGVEGAGWYVDDIELVSCVGQPGRVATDTMMVKYWPKPARAGKKFTVKVKVTADDGTPKGRVVLRKSGKVVGKGKLENGVVKIKTTKGFKPGKISMLAKYLGNNKFKPSDDRFKVKVVKKRKRR